MQIDELRGELTTLANEMEAFEGDVRVLHRRERRRRVLVSSLVAALVVVVTVSTVVVARNHRDDRVHVTGTGSKEVPGAQLSPVDAIVVPANREVQTALDASPFVAQYARLPRGYRGTRNSLVNVPSEVRCALETSDGFALRASSPGPDFAGLLRQRLGNQVKVFDVSEMLGFDVELFLEIGASDSTASSIEARLAQDPSIESFQYVTTSDAYDIFVRDFADQPALVASTKPSDLPESFRIALKSGASVPAAAGRYQHLAGVDTVITRMNSGVSLLYRPDLPVPPGGASACTKP